MCSFSRIQSRRISCQRNILGASGLSSERGDVRVSSGAPIFCHVFAGRLKSTGPRRGDSVALLEAMSEMPSPIRRSANTTTSPFSRGSRPRTRSNSMARTVARGDARSVSSGKSNFDIRMRNGSATSCMRSRDFPSASMVCKRYSVQRRDVAAVSIAGAKRSCGESRVSLSSFGDRSFQNSATTGRLKLRSALRGSLMLFRVLSCGCCVRTPA